MAGDASRQNGKKGGRPRKSREANTKPSSLEAVVAAAETQKPTETPKPTSENPPAVDNPFDLTPKELLFVEAYCGVANFSAYKAYGIAGYSTRGAESTIRVEASKLLGKPKIEAAIGARLATRVQQLRIMDGDEALSRITSHARADIRKMFPPESRIAQLPDDVALSIKSVTPTANGLRIELYDGLRAAEIMAKAAGRLKEHHEHRHKVSLEDLVAGLTGTQNDGAAA